MKQLLILLVFLMVACHKMGVPSAYNAQMNSTNGSNLPTGGNQPTGSNAILLGPNFSSLNVNIFIPKCVSCHSVNSPAGGYPMNSYAAIIGTGHVVAGSPNTSSLFTRVADNSMPPGMPLNASERAAISDWILRGANNDGPPVGPIATPTPIPLAPTFKSIAANILNKQCITCHGPTRADEGVRYSDYVATMRTVRPFNSAGSKLYTEVLNNSMPDNAPALTTQEKQIIKTWIDGGALNN